MKYDFHRRRRRTQQGQQLLMRTYYHPYFLVLSSVCSFFILFQKNCLGASSSSSSSLSSTSQSSLLLSEKSPITLTPSSVSLLHHQQNHNQQQSHHYYDFDKLQNLKSRLDVLEEEAPGILMGFYDAELPSFSVQEKRRNNKRVCITSTCYALLTLALSCESNTYNSIVSWEDDDDDDDDGRNDTEQKDDIIPIRKVMRKLLDSKWRQDDLFQVPLLAYTLLRVDVAPPDKSFLRRAAVEDEQVASKINSLIESVLKSRPHRKYGTEQIHSDYIIYQVCKVFSLLQKRQREYQQEQQLSHGNNKNETDSTTSSDMDENANIGVGGLPANAVPEGASTEVFWGLLRCAEVSSNELCRQLAYRTAGDLNSFDVIRLAYSLLTYLRSTESLSGIAGLSIHGSSSSSSGGGTNSTVPSDDPSPETRVVPLNKKLVLSALSAFFEEQGSNGLWDKGQPIYKSFKGGKGRNMDGAFVFSVNTVGSLLCALPAEYFRPHLAALERTLEWIENHQRVEIVSDYIDPESGQCYGRPLRGWTSPHLSTPNAGPQAWSTAQVLKCIFWMSRTIRQLLHNDVLEEFNGIDFSKNGIQSEDWDRLLDTDLGTPGNGTARAQCRTLKSVLEERVVVPFSKSIDNPSYGAAYSGILFGPPGTAKTSICEALAQRMGYDFCVIDTAAFLADGLSNVAARIRYVFSRLMALDKCVILFDEIEEFALDRDNPNLSMESRMLTTAMLTAINDLRRVKKSIFFIATNRLRAFDSAITRRGRFDMQLFVGTPNLESRVIQFIQQLSNVSIRNEQIKKKAIESYRQYLDSVWTQDAMFMNYLEGLQFASTCAGLVASKNRPLEEDEMAVILKQQAAVMTVRGSARAEYRSNMELSRL